MCVSIVIILYTFSMLKNSNLNRIMEMVIDKASDSSNFDTSYFEIYDKSTKTFCNRLIVVYPFAWTIICRGDNLYTITSVSQFTDLCPPGTTGAVKLHSNQSKFKRVCLYSTHAQLLDLYRSTATGVFKLSYDIEKIQSSPGSFTIIDALNHLIHEGYVTVAYAPGNDDGGGSSSGGGGVGDGATITTAAVAASSPSSDSAVVEIDDSSLVDMYKYELMIADEAATAAGSGSGSGSGGGAGGKRRSKRSVSTGGGGDGGSGDSAVDAPTDTTTLTYGYDLSQFKTVNLNDETDTYISGKVPEYVDPIEEIKKQLALVKAKKITLYKQPEYSEYNKAVVQHYHDTHGPDAKIRYGPPIPEFTMPEASTATTTTTL